MPQSQEQHRRGSARPEVEPEQNCARNDTEARLRAELSTGQSGTVHRRAVALLAVQQGLPISRISQLLGVSRQTIYNWIEAYGMDNEVASLRDAPRSGRPRLWNEPIHSFVQDAMIASPRTYGYSEDYWTARILCQHIARAFKQELSEETLRRRLRQMGYTWSGGGYVNAKAAA